MADSNSNDLSGAAAMRASPRTFRRLFLRSAARGAQPAFLAQSLDAFLHFTPTAAGRYRSYILAWINSRDPGTRLFAFKMVPLLKNVSIEHLNTVLANLNVEDEGLRMAAVIAIGGLAGRKDLRHSLR